MLYDLRNDYLFNIKNSYNNNIINLLNNLIHELKNKKTKLTDKKEIMQISQKIISITKAILSIKTYNKEIENGKEAIKLDNIGKGIAARIDEIINTGKLKELEELKLENIDPEIIIENELCTISGIGPVKAKQLIKLGIVGIDDLIKKYKSGEINIEKNVLTHHITVGLEYYYEINKRIEWDKVHKIYLFLKKEINELNPKLNIKFCGSYRRKLKTCGDIDIILTHNDIIKDEDTNNHDYLLDIVKHLTNINFLVGNLTSEGKTKYMGVLNYKDIIMRIDIRFISLNSYPASLLYFTGSGNFNKIMRKYANDKGYTINEYGIYKINEKGEKTEQVFVLNEEDIFKLIGCLYIQPEERIA